MSRIGVKGAFVSLLPLTQVQVKIQWTKLKSEPIRLYLDEVVVEMETCAELRTPPGEDGGGVAGMQMQMPAGGKYGFTDRVIDGIFLSINSIHVRLKSEVFNASIQVHNLSSIAASRLPSFSACGYDLSVLLKSKNWSGVKRIRV